MTGVPCRAFCLFWRFFFVRDKDVVLRMRAMGVRDVERFPFPSPPPPRALRAAVETLVHIGAIANGGGPRPAAGVGGGDAAAATTVTVGIGGAITPLGRALAVLPIDARLAKVCKDVARKDVAS